ncbi:MAG: PKD domain-containing protein [Candidatus Thermoplasmatota archaeon]|nr:PKD domain-containing protein [Candidatus Thermoplasmatota archaeon]
MEEKKKGKGCCGCGGKKLLSIAIIGLMALAALPIAEAAAVTYGSQVKLGDSDFVPTAFAANVVLAAANVLEVDLGTVADVTDNVFYYDADASATVTANDIRLTPYGTKAAGTLVADADVVEKTGTVVASGYAATVYADVNNVNGYDTGDYVYLTTGGVAALAASTGNAVWSIRLTPCGSFAAGTLVRAGDADLLAYGALVLAVPAGTGVSYFNANPNAVPARIDSGDSVYLAAGATGPGALFPLCSVRLMGSSGAFGSQIKLGDSDFVPTAVGAPVALIAANVLQVDLGTLGVVTDNGFYYDADASGTVTKNDVRLVPCGGKAAGTLVVDADTTEMTAAILIASGYARTVFANINNKNGYDTGDYVYLTTGAAGTFVASTGVAAWSIRMTQCGSYAAGTFVMAGNSDLISYGTAAVAFPAGAGIAYFNANPNKVPVALDAGDSVYLASAATVAGGLFPLCSIRLVGGSGAFGTQTKLGESDFRPTAIAANVPLALANVLEVDLGTLAEVTDNGFYYDADASGTVNKNDVRLVPYGGKAIGSLVADADLVEIGGPLVASGFAAVVFANVNNKNGYDQGDYVYLTTGGAGALTATTTNILWSIRLTPCGSYAAGTFVFAGDTDYNTYKNIVVAFPAGAGMTYFNANPNNVGVAILDTGDNVYFASAATAAAMRLFPLDSIRIAGDILPVTPVTPVTPPAENVAPTCTLAASTLSGQKPVAVTFTMTGADTDGTIASWTLDINNDGTADFVGTTMPASQAYTYTSAGTYTAKLTVTDNDGATATATKTITVSEPVVVLPKLVIDASATVDEEQNFDVKAYVDNNGVVSPIVGVTVTFNGEAKTTNADGKATFKAPSVDADKVYSITAVKTGYQDATAKSITVKVAPTVPGFEALFLVGAVAVAMLLIRKKK